MRSSAEASSTSLLRATLARVGRTPHARSKKTGAPPLEVRGPSGQTSTVPAVIRRPARMCSEDREFLPAAIEIVQTPPSPIAVAFIWLICAVFVAALAWAYFGHVDIYAIASGKIQPSGRSKVIQPLEAGRVVAIFVENGSRVEAGDILLELDPTETAADREALVRDLESTDAEIARRKAAVQGMRLDHPTVLPIAFPSTISSVVRSREEAVLAVDVAQLSATLETLKSQIAQNRATIVRLNSSIAARGKVIALTKERVDMRETVDKKGAGSRAQVIDALERYESEVSNQVGETGQLRETEAAIEANERKMAETVAQFVADQTQKLAEAERKRDRLSQELIKAGSKNERTRITAPASGIVQQLAVNTVGQVVTTGQALMTIVPPDAPLEIEALILNKDIGFVRVGQEAVVKVDAFPFTRYRTIDGIVSRVSADAVDMRTAPNLSEASAAVRPQATSPSSGPGGPELAFPATISLARQSIEVAGRNVNLSPGMTVTVEVKTGTRRIISYLLSPLYETVSQAAHER
jgi:membrane fusion protein, hemolysin D